MANTSLDQWKFAPEPQAVAALLQAVSVNDAQRMRILQQARVLIEGARAHKDVSRIHALVEGFSLSSREGLALMALAEALLRIPDAATAEALIEDKLSDADFENLFGTASDWMGKLSGFGLKLTQNVMGSMAKRVGMPVIRKAAIQGVQTLGKTFVLGETIEDALSTANQGPKGYSYSFDMLGEGARTHEDAEVYFNAYAHAIATLGRSVIADPQHPLKRHGISVKLSALHPRYTALQADQCMPVLAERLAELCRLAADHRVNLTVDAEETDRLTMSLTIMDQALQAPYLRHWDGFGLAVQAYQKRALPLVQDVVDWARSTRRKLGIRLVKGAYWDSEIKRAQILGLPDYPVFTRKSHTDLSYLACANLMLANRAHIIPAFGTHNASTIATILELAGTDRTGFGFQRLHGMGDGLFAQLIGQDLPCSIYAPVGTHVHLLAYLVRRLLENGANSSFVNRLANRAIATDALIDDPVRAAQETQGLPNAKIALPRDMFAPDRVNSQGLDLGEYRHVPDILTTISTALDDVRPDAVSIINGLDRRGSLPLEHTSPVNSALSLGHMWPADDAIVEDAFVIAAAGQAAWADVPVGVRAGMLENFANLLEARAPLFMGLCMREAGKSLTDAVAEVREAVDFCRYYAAQARKLFGAATRMPGPTGELNQLMFEPRGIVVCISPWNFPLAIFIGQVTAALVAGNSVIAKPAEQTPLIADYAVRLLIEAGVPATAVQLVQGDGRVGEKLVGHRRTQLVVFTGSHTAAKSIQKSLADKPGPIAPLIAETGGINAMIVDSSALPEQVCDDVIASAFMSAGQRCSALRLLCIQSDIADRVCGMIAGAMQTLRVGDPFVAGHDMGPLIDAAAFAAIQKHKSRLRGSAKILAEVPMSKDLERSGPYMAPIMAEIRDIQDLDREIFGPVLHVLRYEAGDLENLVEAINRKGFGLTFGVHSRIGRVQDYLARNIRAGNVYVNRSMIGAVVGVQPFGGQGLSGTGPKAGGPHYLFAFATERLVSTDTTAVGGNTTLVTMGG